jgi:opacity protein-like surface antigen
MRAFSCDLAPAFLANDQLMIYATGGLAYGQVGLSGVANINASTTSPPGTLTALAAFNANKLNTGFAAGGGIEGKFFPSILPNCSWKIEYLYLDLGSVDAVVPIPVIPQAGDGISSPAATAPLHSGRFIDNIVRVGFNCNFGH